MTKRQNVQRPSASDRNRVKFDGKRKLLNDAVPAAPVTTKPSMFERLAMALSGSYYFGPAAILDQLGIEEQVRLKILSRQGKLTNDYEWMEKLKNECNEHIARLMTVREELQRRIDREIRKKREFDRRVRGGD